MSTDSPGRELAGTDEELARILGTDFSVVACTRVWEAWQYGTMTEDDFINATESDLPGELIAWRDAAVAAERARWQALKDYLGATIDADAKVFDSFAGTPQQPAFGGLLTANRNTLAKMADLESGSQ